MNMRSKLVRVAAILFSLVLLAGYVVYSHITPNVPPPDPLGLSTIDLVLDPTVVPVNSIFGSFDSELKTPQTTHSGNDLRIITSKSISQPIFSTQNVSSAEVDHLRQARSIRRLMHGTKSGLVELPMPGFLNVEFVDFGISLEPFLGFPPPNDPFRGTLDTNVKAGANDPFGTPAPKP